MPTAPGNQPFSQGRSVERFPRSAWLGRSRIRQRIHHRHPLTVPPCCSDEPTRIADKTPARRYLRIGRRIEIRRRETHSPNWILLPAKSSLSANLPLSPLPSPKRIRRDYALKSWP